MIKAHRPQGTIEPVYEHGKNPVSHIRKGIPKWVTCDASEFITKWLPKFESGKLPACSDAEWEKIKGLFHGEIE